MEKLGIWQFRLQKTEIQSDFYMWVVIRNSIWHKKFIIKIKIFVIIKHFFKLKKALRYVYNVVKLFNTVFYLKHIFILKIDPKIKNFKNLKEILKTWKKFAKIFDNHVKILMLMLYVKVGLCDVRIRADPFRWVKTNGLPM